MEDTYQKSNILLVDDDVAIIKLYEYFLSDDNYALHTALDGAQAMEMIDSIKPDLVISDIVMPKVNGFELCAYLRKSEEFSDIPIVIITYLDDDATKVKVFEAGADDFITKPFSGKLLTARIRSLLKNKSIQSESERADKLKVFYATVVTANHKINQPLSVMKNSIEQVKSSLTQLEINDEDIDYHMNLFFNKLLILAVN
ncbi:response regulator, partial [Thermodesulfobacteriota bacterium]